MHVHIRDRCRKSNYVIHMSWILSDNLCCHREYQSITNIWFYKRFKYEY